jgi:hypothetical protein
MRHAEQMARRPLVDEGHEWAPEEFLLIAE